MRSAGPSRALSSLVRGFAISLAMAYCWIPLQGSTLERLSMDQLVEQSTVIVRARVMGSYGQMHGSVVYTHYSIQVAEQYKGVAPAISDILVPGGTANGLRQEVAGAPHLTVGDEYVLFLWTGKSGATHLMGPQGVFSLTKATQTDPTATREASSELMLDRATGRVVRDERLSLKLSELRTAISSRVKGSVK